MALVKKKKWIWSGSKNSRHTALANETVDLFKPFSNGLQFPGDHNGPQKEWEGCLCHLDIVMVDDKKPEAPEIPWRSLQQEELGGYFTELEQFPVTSANPELATEIRYLSSPGGQEMRGILKAKGELSEDHLRRIKVLEQNAQPLENETKVYLHVNDMGETFGGRMLISCRLTFELRVFRQCTPLTF